MLVVDASVLVAALSNRPSAPLVRRRLDEDDDQAAPEIIDVEVFGVIRGHFLRGHVDRSGAESTINRLHDWPGERLTHRPFLSRAWELRHNVRGWDAFYVALAEAFDATLLTTDARLARAKGPQCDIEVLPVD